MVKIRYVSIVVLSCSYTTNLDCTASCNILLLHLRFNEYDGEEEYWVKTRVSGKREAEESAELIRRQTEDAEARVGRSHL